MINRASLTIGRKVAKSLPQRGRPPGARCLTVLGEIVVAHLRGEMWKPRPDDGQISTEYALQRAAYGKRLSEVYGWVIGDSARGYKLARCPLCEVATCHGSSCQARRALAA